ncbi:CocE/NonD family hydrolase [Spongiactinospora sp. TRM90649]|uniref:alpha/beta hydrolase n=1 Tax=Spongiactinospora sp. TRM90649 TaxID=3031114 RepID=UPI0023F70167|nr:CocE/NonD family hydrolase [Spongiactinospora sp. TRM90649]MDF5758161.1 CocE/NonD family hydrolase [Spongiactinospora sp. TRM90649]
MLSLRKSTIVAVLLVALTALSALWVPPATASTASTAGQVTRTPVTLQNGDVSLRGMIYAPSGGGPPRPAIVMVPGAGPRRLEGLADQAEAFARQGVTALVYDKRTTGYSQTNRSFSDLADDALAGIGVLRGQPDVDPGRVGVWGFSEGGWVAPLAASRSAQVAFLITVGAGAYTPERVQVWSNANYLAHAGVSGPRIRPLAVNLTRVMVAAGMFGASGHEPVPVLRKIRQPVLGLWGEHERSVPPADGMRVFAETLRAAGNDRYTLKVVPGADHSLEGSDDGFSTDSRLVAGYVETVVSWIDGLGSRGARTTTASADPPPAQEVAADPVPPLAWWESLPVQLGALILLLVAFAAYPAAATLRRRGSRGGPARRWPALLSLTGTLAVLGAVLYHGYLLATAAGAPGPVLLGRPVVWLILQVMVLCAAGTAVGTALTLGRTRRTARFTLAGGILLIPWALYWGLLVP